MNVDMNDCGPMESSESSFDSLKLSNKDHINAYGEPENSGISPEKASEESSVESHASSAGAAESSSFEPESTDPCDENRIMSVTTTSTEGDSSSAWTTTISRSEFSPSETTGSTTTSSSTSSSRQSTSSSRHHSKPNKNSHHLSSQDSLESLDSNQYSTSDSRISRSSMTDGTHSDSTVLELRKAEQSFGAISDCESWKSARLSFPNPYENGDRIGSPSSSSCRIVLNGRKLINERSKRRGLKLPIRNRPFSPRMSHHQYYVSGDGKLMNNWSALYAIQNASKNVPTFSHTSISSQTEASHSVNDPNNYNCNSLVHIDSYIDSTSKPKPEGNTSIQRCSPLLSSIVDVSTGEAEDENNCGTHNDTNNGHKSAVMESSFTLESTNPSAADCPTAESSRPKRRNRPEPEFPNISPQLYPNNIPPYNPCTAIYPFKSGRLPSHSDDPESEDHQSDEVAFLSESIRERSMASERMACNCPASDSCEQEMFTGVESFEGELLTASNGDSQAGETHETQEWVSASVLETIVNDVCRKEELEGKVKKKKAILKDGKSKSLSGIDRMIKIGAVNYPVRRGRTLKSGSGTGCVPPRLIRSSPLPHQHPAGLLTRKKKYNEEFKSQPKAFLEELDSDTSTEVRVVQTDDDGNILNQFSRDEVPKGLTNLFHYFPKSRRAKCTCFFCENPATILINPKSRAAVNNAADDD